MAAKSFPGGGRGELSVRVGVELRGAGGGRPEGRSGSLDWHRWAGLGWRDPRNERESWRRTLGGAKTNHSGRMVEPASRAGPSVSPRPPPRVEGPLLCCLAAQCVPDLLSVVCGASLARVLPSKDAVTRVCTLGVSDSVSTAAPLRRLWPPSATCCPARPCHSLPGAPGRPRRLHGGHQSRSFTLQLHVDTR